MEFDIENQRKGGENILMFINSQLDSLSLELRSSKDSLMLYQRKNNLPPISFESNEDTLDGFDLAEFEPR